MECRVNFFLINLLNFKHIINRYNIYFHCYANDPFLYILLKPGTTRNILDHIIFFRNIAHNFLFALAKYKQAISNETKTVALIQRRAEYREKTRVQTFISAGL